MRDQRFGATQADRYLHDLKMIEQGKGLLLAAFDIESEGRTRSRTLPVEHRLARVALLEEAEIVHPRYFGMTRQGTVTLTEPRANLGREATSFGLDGRQAMALVLEMSRQTAKPWSREARRAAAVADSG
jgi:hypothetical protein